MERKMLCFIGFRNFQITLAIKSTKIGSPRKKVFHSTSNVNSIYCWEGSNQTENGFHSSNNDYFFT